MSNKQLAVLWVGIGLILLMCLFPPWLGIVNYRGIKTREEYGYRCIFSPPPGVLTEESSLTIYLNTSRLVVQCVAIALLTGAGIYTLRTKGK